LNEAIGRINATAETRFRETFAKIQSNYQDVFSTLFEGGEARLELEDETYPLESPIRILARPGGKRLLSVTQLSGGERALTAISLLFGIYLVKPSPFCILDEVDAPLDDANLLRFLKLIKSFSESTQFIVITHNKMTMEASDVLYGVTMETPGVSKVVSVKFGGNGN
jgi:chromosome segregation protein